MLSVEDVEKFERDGFLLLKHFLTKEACLELLECAKVEIKKANDPVETEEDYYNIIDKVKKGDRILIFFKRGEGNFYRTIEIPEKDEE